MFQLLLIRHGQSANNALPESQRVPDPGLTDVGQQQAAALAEWFHANPPTHLYCSAFRRALETTAPVARKIGLRPEVRWDLFEQGGCYSGYLPGEKQPFPGMGRREIVEHFGDWEIDDRIHESGWYHGKPLETEHAARQRAESVWRWVLEDLVAPTQEAMASHRAAFVIHADFKVLLLDTLVRAGQLHASEIVLEFFRQQQEPWNTSISQLSWEAGRWRIDAINSMAHLPKAYWTS